jgi:hypothetical protein
MLDMRSCPARTLATYPGERRGPNSNRSRSAEVMV